ncbi:retrovirus-related pol polyprotein from transposon TNT 1-94, partial [Tanacetum coccineum]
MKRHLKTPYEIFRKRIPNINCLYVFGCPVYIHNHKDHVGKFDEKDDDGYLLGYSLVSKAFKFFNTRRQHSHEHSQRYQTNNNYVFFIDPNEYHGQVVLETEISGHLSSPSVEDTSVQNTIPIPIPPLPIPSIVTPAPQDRWFKDKHIELVNIIDFISEEEPKKVSEALKHPGWVNSMQDELNQFDRNK